MKKLSILFTLLSVFLFTTSVVFADNNEAVTTEEVAPAEETTETAPAAAEEEEEVAPTKKKKSGHQILMKQFIDGGAGFMSTVLICLILGLAFAIERIITLTLATTSSRKLLERIDAQLSQGNVEEAKEICKTDRSPIASIMFQGLQRVKEGLDVVEKSVVSYGSVQMGLLEKGLTWIALFISLAPMLGFMGTVIGMIGAFDAIAEAGDISPKIVAGGIKVALLTTVFGLIVAVILQVFYNYIVSKIDAIVHDMEDASITFVDMVVKYKLTDNK